MFDYNVTTTLTQRLLKVNNEYIIFVWVHCILLSNSNMFKSPRVTESGTVKLVPTFGNLEGLQRYIGVFNFRGEKLHTPKHPNSSYIIIGCFIFKVPMFIGVSMHVHALHFLIFNYKAIYCSK